MSISFDELKNEIIANNFFRLKESGGSCLFKDYWAEAHTLIMMQEGEERRLQKLCGVVCWLLQNYKLFSKEDCFPFSSSSEKAQIFVANLKVQYYILFSIETGMNKAEFEKTLLSLTHLCKCSKEELKQMYKESMVTEGLSGYTVGLIDLFVELSPKPVRYNSCDSKLELILEISKYSKHK